MNKEVTIRLSVDAKTGALTQVKHALGGVEEKSKKSTKALGLLHTKLLGIGAALGGVFALSKAFDGVVGSGFEANKTMDASLAKLTAMVSASRGYETVTGKSVDAMQRQNLVAMEVNATMDILKATNAKTAMGMSELVDVYALAKPGMDKANWAMEDQIEILKRVTNTASAFTVSSEELSSGIDDMAAGTWDATSGFGKMMKAVGVTKEGFAAAGDKVAYLKEALKETGEVQDTWAVATSNLDVAWDTLTGRLTAPIFDIAKEGVKELSAALGGIDDSSIDGVSNALVWMAKISVRTGGYVGQSFNGIRAAFSSTQIAFYGLVHYFGEGLEWTLNSFKLLGRGIEEIFVGAFNVVGKKWNSFIDGMFNHPRMADWARTLGFEMPDASSFRAKEIALDAYKPVKLDLEWSRSGLDEAVADTKGALDDIIAQTPLKRADAFIEKIDEIVTKTKSLDGATDTLVKKPTITPPKKKPKQPQKPTKQPKQTIKEAETEAEKLKKKLDEAAKSFSSHFTKGFELILHGDFAKGLSQMFDNAISSSVSSVSSAFSMGLGNLATGAGSFKDAFSSLNPMDWLGAGLSLLGGLFSSEVSQAEIDKATGRTDLNDSSIQDMGGMFEKAMNPQLDATYTMSKYLRNMEKDFGIVAQAIVGSVGGSSLDLTGMNYVPTAKYGTLGFSSKTSELLGTGLDLGGTLGDVDASGYISELIKKSSWWGLSKSTSLKITDVDLPEDTIVAINDAMNDGISSILTAGVALGFDQNSLDEQIEAYEIEVGKINLQDMSEEDASNAISNAFSEIFSGAVDGSDLSSLTDRYSQVGEESYATLLRIATEYEQASYAFTQAGMGLTDGGVVYDSITTATTSWVDAYYKGSTEITKEAYDGASNWAKAMGIYTQTTKEVTDYVTESVASLYTAQEKYLDIVEYSGGLEQFNENYSAFIDNFYTDAEKQQMSYYALATQFENLGVAMPTTDDGFRELVNSYDVVDEATAETKAELLSLSGAFADLNDSIAESVLAIYDLYTSDLSYYTTQQKDDFISATYEASNDDSTTIELMEDYLSSLKETSTREDYMSAYNEYVAMKKDELADATNSDLLTELTAIRVEIEDLKIATQDGVRMA